MSCSSITGHLCPLWAVDGHPHSDAFFTFAPPGQAFCPPPPHPGPLMGVLPVMQFSSLAPPLQARLPPPPVGRWWVSSQRCSFAPCGFVRWLSSPWGSHAPCGPFWWVVLPARQPCPLLAFRATTLFSLDLKFYLLLCWHIFHMKNFLIILSRCTQDTFSC